MQSTWHIVPYIAVMECESLLSISVCILDSWIHPVNANCPSCWMVCCSLEAACAGNRRLDEWVPASRFESLEKYCVDTYNNGLHSAAGLDLINSGDRKVTRNQKRKHDAINHVQTVMY